MPIDLGTEARVQWQREPATAGHSVTLTLVQPDGTLLDPAIVVEDLGAGRYEGTFDAVQPGRYVLRWNDTDDDVAYTDTREVWPADPRFLISLEDAIAALRWRPSDVATNGETLRLYVAAATEVIEDITGALLARTITQTANGGRTGVLLWERPDGPVTITVDGKPYADAIVDVNAAIAYASNRDGWFPEGRQNITLVYQAGAAKVAPSIQLAARELVRHLWQVGQQAQSSSSEPTTQNLQATGLTRSGFAVPNRVIELCGNHHALPGLG